MKIEIPEVKKLVYEMRFPVRWGDMDAMGHVNNTVYFRYLEGYYSLFDGGRPVRWTAHPRGSDLMQTQAHHPHVQRMMRFTAGMVRLRIENGNLWLTDLRMGQEGAYVFDFDLGPRLAPGQAPPAAVQHSERPPVRESLKWLWVRMWGADLPPMSATP